ncbi:MAG: N-acetylneuraminate synthase [Bacteroidetes bacterium]|nr:MAG: N-acetylneuraminate synthase [Bacteroidota bacterium]
MRHHTLIIAEAGVNHNGSLDKAKELIDAAAEAGVDYVKFQTFKADKIVSKSATKADYQKANEPGSDESQYDMLKKLELSDSDHIALIEYAEEKGVRFFSTAFDTEGLDYLNSLGFDRFKIPSGEITNYPYLVKIASFGKPVILSTGMATMSEIGEAIEILERGISKDDITVLHCNTEYPTPMDDVNLMAMLSIARTYGVQVGYSDHTLGIEVPIAAVALGATVIEKHFTLDRNMPGPDHKASLEPSELIEMVASIRNIEKAISGNGEKVPSASEKRNIAIARKSLHLNQAIEKGQVFTESHLIPLRPGDGISPMRWNEVLGKTASKNLAVGHQLKESDFS